MKKTIIILLILGVVSSCKNRDWEFDDFGYTTTYFPFQTPVRTLVLGDYNFDNTNDNNHRFVISAAMGGVYHNEKDREVDFVIDETLTANLYAGNVKIEPLPANYYSLSSNNKIVIKKGEYNGGVTVQLNDAFFEDPLTTSVKYVIPLRIVSSDTDSILRGNSEKSNPDPRILGDWVVAPKNFTLFGIKYVNEYHGRYLLRGTSVVKNLDGSEVEKNIYRRNEVEQDDVVSVNTVDLNTVRYSNNVRLSSGSPGQFRMLLEFDDNNNCTIDEEFGFEVTGTGKLVKEGDSWGGKARDVLHLQYQINDGTYIHSVNDTLVFRDKAIALEEFTANIRY